MKNIRLLSLKFRGNFFSSLQSHHQHQHQCILLLLLPCNLVSASSRYIYTYMLMQIGANFVWKLSTTAFVRLGSYISSLVIRLSSPVYRFASIQHSFIIIIIIQSSFIYFLCLSPFQWVMWQTNSFVTLFMGLCFALWMLFIYIIEC